MAFDVLTATSHNHCYCFSALRFRIESHQNTNKRRNDRTNLLIVIASSQSKTRLIQDHYRVITAIVYFWNMLSFLRSKSSDVSVDKTVDGINKLNLHPNINDSSAQMSKIQSTTSHLSPEDLLKSLGYQNATDLKETIYGGFGWRITCYIWVNHIDDNATFFRYSADDSWSREAINTWGFACGIRRGNFRSITNQRQCSSGKTNHFESTHWLR